MCQPVGVTADDGEDVRTKLHRAHDPTGEMARTLERFNRVLSHPLLARLVGIDVSEVQSLADEHRALIDTAVGAIERFAPWGWAPSGQIHHDAYARAIALDRAGAGRHEVEQVIADGWDDVAKLRRSGLQIPAFYPPGHDLWPACQGRGELILAAAKHHKKQHYEASVPIVLSQIEGITKDVTGKLFFSGDQKRKAEIVEDAAISTFDESLPVVRALFSASQNTTTADDGLSRHGILHGRTVGYGTHVTSLKCFALLQAVVEWLQPMAQRSYKQRG